MLKKELILRGNKYLFGYSYHFINLIIILTFIFIIFLYNYQNYYTLNGKMINLNNDYYLEIEMQKSKMDYIYKNRELIVNNICYDYKVYYYDKWAKKIYLKIKLPNNYYTDNKKVEIRIQGENKKIIYYIFDRIREVVN